MAPQLQFLILGNGKRSGMPPGNVDTTSLRQNPSFRQASLRQALLGDRQPVRMPDNSDLLLETSALNSEFDSLYPDVEEIARLQDLEKARTLLSELVCTNNYNSSA